MTTICFTILNKRGRIYNLIFHLCFKYQSLKKKEEEEEKLDEKTAHLPNSCSKINKLENKK